MFACTSDCMTVQVTKHALWRWLGFLTCTFGRGRGEQGTRWCGKQTTTSSCQTSSIFARPPASPRGQIEHPATSKCQHMYGFIRPGSGSVTATLFQLTCKSYGLRIPPTLGSCMFVTPGLAAYNRRLNLGRFFCFLGFFAFNHACTFL